MNEGVPTEDDLSEAPRSAGDTVDKLLARALEAPPVFPTLPPGTIVAKRYEIERVLGAGGMGTVYLARDHQLDRSIALKLHRTSGEPERMHREAVAMAKLAHPNVVAVFEIGSLDGRAFVAMEYIEGASMRDWLAERTRSWREILAALLAAGEGLVAAHDAGLVHRDVKPDNILVGADGRVRIGDFGLAQLRGIAGVPVRADLATMTETGHIVGTPAYMAPEQIEGLKLDARTDQFSFCIAAWEALAGARPYGGANTDELQAAIYRGEPMSPKRRMPASLRRVLTRGMAADPAKRWPSLRALLTALRAAERRPRVIAFGVAGALAIAAVATYSLWPASDPAAMCLDAGDEIDTLVPAHLGVSAATAVRRGGRTNADEEAARVGQLAELARANYRQHSRITCAAHARKQWSDQLYAASRECSQIAAQTTRELLLVAPDAATQPSDVLRILMHVPNLVACTDADMLAGWRWLATDQGASADVVSARARLDVARVLAHDGQLHYARTIRDSPQIQAIARDNRAVGRRLAMVRATIAFEETDLRVAEDLFAEVFYTSRAEGDADLVLAAAGQMIDLTGETRRDRVAAERWIRDGLVEAQRYQVHSRVEAFGLLLSAASATEGFDNHAEAVRLADLAEQLSGKDEERSMEVLPIRANAYAGIGDMPKALAAAAQYVDRTRSMLGPRHPRVADALALQAALLADGGQPAEALRKAQEAVVILNEQGGDEGFATATAAMNLGVMLLQFNDEGAAAQLERARGIWVAAHGENHPDVALVDTNLAIVYLDRKETDRALELLHNATAIQEATLGPKHQEFAVGLYNLAVAERDAGKLEAALATAKRCAEIFGAIERGSARYADSLTHVAFVQHLLGRNEDALASANSALAQRDCETGTFHGAWQRLEAARAMIALRRDLPKAKTLLIEARERYASLNSNTRVAEIDGMLAKL
ncbi:MAG: serine/threonine-protein kinase [Kofleriaceae bacterium]